MRTSYWLVGSQLELTGRLYRALDQVRIIVRTSYWLVGSQLELTDRLYWALDLDHVRILVRTSYWLVGSQLELTGRLYRALDQVRHVLHIYTVYITKTDCENQCSVFAQTKGYKVC